MTSLVTEWAPPTIRDLGGMIFFLFLLLCIVVLAYARRRPDPFPRVFGFHELFHLCAIGGSAAFFAVIWVWVIPFPRP